MTALPVSWGWAIFVVTAILMFLISYIVYKKVKLDSSSFLVASRGVPWPLVASSIAATELWAGSLLASAEGVFNWGIGGMWMYALPTPLSFTIFAVIAHRTRYLAPNGTTIGSWVKTRFGPSTHIIFCVVALYIMFVFTMFQVIGGASLFSGMFGISYTAAALVIGVVFVGYYLVAGMWSTLVTGFIQYFIVVLVLVIMVPMIYAKMGGVGNIFQMVSEQAVVHEQGNWLNLFRADGVINYFLLTFGGWGVIATMSNYAWQRAYAVEPKGVTKAMLFGGWSWMPMALVSSSVGLCGIALGLTGKLAVGTDVFPAVVGQLLPPGASIFLAVALLFAIYSTGTSYLGGFTALLASDFYEQYTGKKSSLKMLRVLSVVMGVLVVSCVVALQKVSLLDFMLACGVFIPTPFFSIVFGLYWKKTTKVAANVATVFTLAVALYMMFLTDLPLWITYVTCYVLSALLCVVISLIKPDNFDYEAMREKSIKALEAEGAGDRAAKLNM